MQFTTPNQHFAERARLAFTRGMPTSDPVALVEAGWRTNDEWFRVLNTFRDHEARVISNQARERCAFSGDDALRFKVLKMLADGMARATSSIHLELPEARLSSIRKLLCRIAESTQVTESKQTIRGLEVTIWTITLRGKRELNAHLARIETQLTSASKLEGMAHTSASK